MIDVSIKATPQIDTPVQNFAAAGVYAGCCTSKAASKIRERYNINKRLNQSISTGLEIRKGVQR